MAELDAACCSPDARETCCEPAAKAGCCGSGGTCGCAAGKAHADERGAMRIHETRRAHEHSGAATVRIVEPRRDAPGP
ncbi:MAG TPA: hypothetical protein VGN08_05870 [Solirubrobacteraceae bacterium]|jgi:hypothetical protein